MTDKRFTLDDENDDIIFDNNTITDMSIKELYWLIDCDQKQKLVDLMNELHEENIQLKNELQFRNCVGKSAQILTRSDWEDLE